MTWPEPSGGPGRPTCYRCWKPGPMCICERIEPVDNRTGVSILQHPRERRHPIGTARIARLGLRNVQLAVAGRGSGLGLECAFEVPDGAALLYPRDPVRPEARSRSLADLAPGERPRHLVVLDGTWAHANRIYRANGWLHALPHVGLELGSPSRYRIRREPAPHCLSTVESIVEALRILEPDTRGLDGLLGVFDAMIDEQVEVARLHAGRSGSVRRPARKLARRASGS